MDPPEKKKKKKHIGPHGLFFDFVDSVLNNGPVHQTLVHTISNGGYSQNGADRGLRGTFVHGCMLDVWLVACGREKLTLGELLFAPFA